TDWLRQLMGLPADFDGVINDTASSSSLYALAAARDVAYPDAHERGLFSQPVGRVYASDQTHTSIEKAALTLGFGQDGYCAIASDSEFRLRPAVLRAAIESDIAHGVRPVAVVATLGTTSSSSIDPVGEIAVIAREFGLWLHVDAAYAGPAAIVPELRPLLAGWEHADSIVVNPHKWLFTPFDLSAFYCRRMDRVREAFSVTPSYLQTPNSEPVRNLMDTGVQLGRRFRALKLWMVLRHFGAEGMRRRLAEHIRLAALFASWVDASETFERLAPVPFSVVCFRACPPGLQGEEPTLDDLNRRLLDDVNATGDVFLSHTSLDGRFALRLAVGHIRTTERHVARAWELLEKRLAASWS
ncbi:MAG TPA: amino acid decarboxylase, partial [Acidobacteria bacterium]|nr:amino acid decarboxylase [Acidobacteriota bacterium]